ncbi:MAG: hypothetical protein JRN62_09505 [Nitrososphaerota archaeon]|nr:hypothetical protein [Nitrososphaerota archaeon]
MSEEVCLQCLVVSFRSGRWEEWFSNPTAGPWKKVRIEGVGDEDQIRFEKEQDRPDLVVADRKSGLVIMLEAKDSIGSLLETAQIRKSIGVFASGFVRLDSILARHGSRLFAGTEPKLICGYLFPTASQTDILELNRLHMQEANRIKNSRLQPHVVFEVKRASNDDLRLAYRLYDSSQTVSALLGKVLPNTITPTRQAT